MRARAAPRPRKTDVRRFPRVNRLIRTPPTSTIEPSRLRQCVDIHKSSAGCLRRCSERGREGGCALARDSSPHRGTASRARSIAGGWTERRTNSGRCATATASQCSGTIGGTRFHRKEIEAMLSGPLGDAALGEIRFPALGCRSSGSRVSLRALTRLATGLGSWAIDASRALTLAADDWPARALEGLGSGRAAFQCAAHNDHRSADDHDHRCHGEPDPGAFPVDASGDADEPPRLPPPRPGSR